MGNIFNYNVEICVAFVRICYVQKSMIININLNNKKTRNVLLMWVDFINHKSKLQYNRYHKIH